MQIFQRNLLFVSGKGGVGKTVISQAIARCLSREGKRVLWVTFEDPLLPLGENRQVGDSLFHLNAEAGTAFEEYVGLLLGGIAKLLAKNSLVRKLARLAPGIHELVLLGKVWFEREKFDHVVVDMPSTGYGVAMFQSVRNFRELFRGGPIQRDADRILSTLEDPERTGMLIVTLPEEMPVRESMELKVLLTQLFPKNPPEVLVNRSLSRDFPPGTKNPEAVKTAGDFAIHRAMLEAESIEDLRKQGSEPILELGFILPPTEPVEGCAEALRKKGL